MSAELRTAGRLVVGIGEFLVSSRPADVIVTYALGSCVAVCLWDPVAGVGGLLHFLLPDSRINAGRARVQPAAFADLGIPLLFQAAYKAGAVKARCVVKLTGGADVAGNGSMDIGKRNILAARNVLWRNGTLIRKEHVGGRFARTVSLALHDGTVAIVADGHEIDRL